jgi:uncharacterized membrane protein
MLEFFAALAVFLLSHSLPTRTGLRQWLSAAIGERAYLICYSILSILLLGWLISSASRAPYVPLWDLESWHYRVPLLLMVPASFLFAGGAAIPNPLSITFSRRRFDADRPGLVGITRHPILWAFALWSFGHVLPNGDLVSVIMFGGFGLFAVIGMLATDRRKRRSLGNGWHGLARITSVIPFVALLAGRASPRWHRSDLLATLIGGALLYFALLRLHPHVIGPDPAAFLG